MSRSARRWAGLALVGALLALFAHNALRFPGTDFHVYYDAGRRFGGAVDLYRFADGYARYRYAPGAAALFAPLAALPYPVAKAVWLALSACVALAVAAWMQRRVAPARWFAGPLAWACLFHPVAQELQLGQVHLLVLGAVVAAFALEDRGHDLAAGGLLALAAALKVTPALFVADAVLRRRWREVAGFVAGVTTLGVVALLRYGASRGLAEHAVWVRGQGAFTAALVGTCMNQSIFGILDGFGVGLGGASVAALGVAALALSVKESNARRLLSLLAVVLASPNGWVQGFVLAAPLTTALIADGGAAAALATALALATGVLAYDVLGAGGERWTLSRHLVGLAMLGSFLVGRFAWRRASRSDAEHELGFGPGPT